MKQPIDYFSSDQLRKDLKGKTVRGGVVTGVAQGMRIFIGFATIPVLARLLQPEDFGLVAMVGFFTNFAAMFVDSGLSKATIQREEITREQVSNLFWMATGLGCCVALLVAAFSPVISWFYAEPRLTAITLALAGSYIISGLTIQHQALMRRGMQFQGLAFIQVASTLSGQVAAIAWAWQMRGQENDYWALVLMPLATAATKAILTWLLCTWRPGRPRRGAGTRELAVFGANLTGFNLTNYFARNADNMLIGWWWGITQLGYYERAYKIFMMPMQQINGPISAVAIPLLSRLVHNEVAYRRVYRFILGKTCCLAGGLVVFLMVNSDWVVEIVLGKKWLPSAPIFSWLALAGLRQLATNPTGWLLISQGRGKDMLLCGIVGSLITVSGFLIGLPWGPIGVAISYAIGPLVLGMPYLFWVAGRSGPMRRQDLWAAFLSPLIIPLVVFVPLALLRYQLGDVTPWYGISCSAGLASVVWLAAMCTTQVGKTNLLEMTELINNLRTKQNEKTAVDL